MPFSTHALLAAMSWRLRRWVGDGVVDRAWVRAARIRRPHLVRPVFIGIAGSAGKTTCKELLREMLQPCAPTVANEASLNVLPEVAKTLLRVRHRHRFCVSELSEDRPHSMDGPLALLRPSIGVVTVVRDDHLGAFTDRAALVAEIGKVLACLPVHGTAVLNADDETVLRMAAACRAKVLTFGVTPAADLRATAIESIWPEGMKLTLQWQSETLPLSTQLHGAHWVTALLGAVGAALAAGLTLAQCVAGLSRATAFTGRMQPVALPDGVTFIRDDFKAPIWTVDACLGFLRSARATRKFLIVGELSDVGASGKGRHYAGVARAARSVADTTVFVGPWASSALRAAGGDAAGQVLAFGRVQDAAAYLASAARAGDLVLLKGTNKKDHLLRIILDRTSAVTCWRDNCGREMFCDECPDLRRPPPPAREADRMAPPLTAPGAPTPPAHWPGEQIVIGLGNPEPRYRNTPHNVGSQAVDFLARCFDLEWTETQAAWLARGKLNGRPLCLCKVKAPMNLTGASLVELAQQMGFRAEHCIAIYDDLSLPKGTVKVRLVGGAGGHRGMASILEAFQSDRFRRIKIGVSPAVAESDRAEYVLRPFDANDVQKLDETLVIVASRLRALFSELPKAP